MRWEDLTGDQFPEAVKQAEGVCLLPFSCIERHGHHLPLGTDMFIGRELCRRVAELEPAVVFPDYFFTQILEARHTPGTFGIQPELIISLLENVCREIARNGLKKIVIVNAHGGNDHLINYFAQIQLASRRDYVVYIPQPAYMAEDPATAAQWETVVDGHAGERETSMILAIRPELVNIGKHAHPMAKACRWVGSNSCATRALTSASGGMPTIPPITAATDVLPRRKKGKPGSSTAPAPWRRVVRTIKDDKDSKRLQDEFFSKVG